MADVTQMAALKICTNCPTSSYRFKHMLYCLLWKCLNYYAARCLKKQLWLSLLWQMLQLRQKYFFITR